MRIIIESGSQNKLESHAPPGSSICDDSQIPIWPVPTGKEWSSICTVAIRAAVVLGWVHRRIAEQAQHKSNAVANPVDVGQEQHQLMVALLHLLDQLLTGKLCVQQVFL